jgi:hypothetical protein
MAFSNINWNPDAPFNLLRNLFENLVDGWKQTLYTVFEDNNLRIDIFKNMIIRYEIDNCKNQRLFNAFIVNDNICYRILTQVCEINLLNFNGMEVCFRNLFIDLTMIRKF